MAASRAHARRDGIVCDVYMEECLKACECFGRDPSAVPVEAILLVFRRVVESAQELPDNALKIIFHYVLHHETSTIAIEFLVQALSRDPTLGDRTINANVIKLGVLVTELRRPATYATPVGDLVAALIGSSRYCCDYLVSVGLMDSVSQCLLGDIDNTAFSCKIWGFVARVVKHASPDLVMFNTIFELCVNADFGHSKDSFILVLTSCSILVDRAGHELNDDDVKVLDDFIRKAFVVTRESRSGEALIWLSRITTGRFGIGATDEFWRKLLDITDPSSPPKAIRILLRLTARVLSRWPKFVTLLIDCGFMTQMVGKSVNGTHKDKVCVAQFLAVLTDRRVFDISRDWLIEFKGLTEWTDILLSTDSDDDKDKIMEALCNIAQLLRSKRVAEDVPLTSIFRDPSLSSVFDDECIRTRPKLTDRVLCLKSLMPKSPGANDDQLQYV